LSCSLFGRHGRSETPECSTTRSPPSPWCVNGSTMRLSYGSCREL
jgi:hypothetical protein